MHMRRLVWHFSPEDEWVTYGVDRMMFGDKPVTTALEVVKRKVADLGVSIDPDASEMIKDGYSDDGVAGGDDEDVDRMMGERVDPITGPSIYKGTIPRIVGLGGFKLKYMVRSGQNRSSALKKFNGQVLGLPWHPEEDLITMHLGVNLSAKRQKIQ